MDAAERARLGDEIVQLAGQLAAATCRWLVLVGRFDAAEAWKAWGCRSCAHWLSWQCGVELGAAREKLRVARRLAELPLVRAAFAAGELSYSKVRALTRIAIADTEADLVDLARHATAAHTERLARAYRRAEAYASADAARLAELRREVTWRFDDDGSLLARVRLPPDDGARLIAALQAGLGSAPGASAAQRAADALMGLVDGDGATMPTVVIHADADTITDAGYSSSDERGGDDRPAGGDRDGGGVAAAAGRGRPGGELPAAAARRLTCDARVQVVSADRAGQPLRLGRSRRTVPPGLRRALEARDRGCRFPGCPAERWLRAHHLRHWADGGPTDIDNLVLLCGHHHKLVHEFGWNVHWAHPPGRPADLAVSDPDGRRVGPEPIRLAGTLADLDNPAISPDAIRSLWAGEPFDLATAVEVLLWRKHRTGPPLSETAA